MITVSIVTVVYNAVETIEKTIKSVLQQDYRNVEYIIVDGGSTDGTKEILERYSKLVTHILSEPDEGIYDAMNKGIRLASGDVIAFLNCGDSYEKDTCTRVAGYFEQNNVDILIGVARMLEGGVFTRIRDNQPENIELSMPCCHQAVFAKRKLFSVVGMYDTNYRICADFDWLLRVFFSKARFIWTKEIYATYDGEGISARMELTRINEAREVALKYAILYHKQDNVEKINHLYGQWLEAFKLNNKNMELFAQNAEYVRAVLNKSTCYIWGAGNGGKRCLELLKTAGVEIAGFIDTNRRHDKWYGIPIYLPEEVDKNIIICIAAPKYEEEIWEQALQMGFIEENIVSFSRLKEKLFVM